MPESRIETASANGDTLAEAIIDIEDCSARSDRAVTTLIWIKFVE
jgi:hypothetical protein